MKENHVKNFSKKNNEKTRLIDSVYLKEEEKRL